MTNNQNTTDLLQKAKNTETNLLSGNELSDIIGTGRQPGTKHTKFIKGRLVMSITSILAVAATAAYLAFTPFSEPDLLQKPGLQNTQKEQQSVKVEDVAKPTTITKNNQVNSDIALNNTNAKEPAKSKTLAYKQERVNIEGINIISIENAQDLKRLGIIDKGGVFEIQAFKNLDDVSRFSPVITLSKKEGKNSVVINTDTENKNICYFAPQLITNAHGNKELSLFDAGNSKIMSRTSIFEDTLSSELNANINISAFINDDAKYSIEADSTQIAIFKSYIDDDSLQQRINNLIANSANNSASEITLHLGDIIKQSRLNAENTSITLSDEDNVLLVDSILNQLNLMTFKVGTDSANNSYSTISINPPDKQSSSISMSFSTSNEYTKESLGLESEEDLEFFKSQLPTLDSMIRNTGHVHNLVFDDSRLNKMLAVAIKIDNKSVKPDFILWYDISQELIDALPEEYKEKLAPELLALAEGDYCAAKSLAGEETYCDVWRACNGDLKEMRIYPVPVVSDFTVEYNLNEDRILDFTIHDLYGEEVATLKSGQKRSAGLQTENFNVKLQSGMYLLSITSDKGERTVQRFVVK